MNKDYLTATDFYRYFQCPHWPFYERFATEDEQRLKRPQTPGEELRLENGVAHEKQVVANLFLGSSVKEATTTGDAEKDCEATMELMKQGVPHIYQGTLTYGDWTGRPDLLERHEGESALGSWFYVPVDIKSTHALEKYQKMQLVFYSILLEKLQKRFPAEPAIINAYGTRLSFVAADSVAEFESIEAELERIRAKEKPDPVLRKSCYDTGPWGAVCERFAKETNDIALLYNVDVKKLRALRQLGVRTVDDAAEMDPSVLDGAAPGLRLHGLEVAKRQAQALKDGLVIVREAALFPTTGLEIHFDIESDPPNDVDYLYGFLLREPTGDRYISFVARTLEEEKDMWASFLAWIETLPEDYHVYHFAAYEFMRLNILKERYGGSPALDVFCTRLIDLKEVVNTCVIFPLYFYGLKYIAPFLGFSWTGSVKSGGQSVDVFEKYLTTRDTALLDSIVAYNEDDVRATAYLKDWLVKYASEITAYEQPYPWKR